MPEGDTIFRTATTLNRVLAGERITGFRSPLPTMADAGLVGKRIERVEARGKNLLIHIDDGRALYSHMRMAGSWHIYRPGESYQKPERQAKAVFETAAMVAVCFNAPVVALLTQREITRHPVLQRLGPDLLHSTFDGNEACRRLRERNELAIGVALIDQGALAGIGNIYKSETLFLCRMNPFRAVQAIPDPQLQELISKARELMMANLGSFPRTTRHALDGQRLWVYGRSRRPCRRCGTIIRMKRQGTDARSTYWCPHCQL
jgi:endonuclease-8